MEKVGLNLPLDVAVNIADIAAARGASFGDVAARLLRAGLALYDLHQFCGPVLSGWAKQNTTAQSVNDASAQGGVAAGGAAPATVGQQAQCDCGIPGGSALCVDCEGPGGHVRDAAEGAQGQAAAPQDVQPSGDRVQKGATVREAVGDVALPQQADVPQ